MNRIAALLVLTLSLPLAARADEASHRAKAEQVMLLLHTDKMVQQVSDNLIKQISDVANKAAGDNPSPETKAKVEDFKKQASQVIDAQVGWKVLEPGFIDIYTKNFTEEELDGIIAFYKSPAGIAILGKMPEVNTQVQQFGQSHMQSLQPQLQQLFAGFRTSVTPASGAGPSAPAAAPATPPAPAPAAPGGPVTTPK